MASTAPYMYVYIYVYGYKLMDRNMGLYGVRSPLITRITEPAPPSNIK